MTDRGEHTSKQLATLAARVMSMSDDQIAQLATEAPELFRSLAATALTQTADNADGDN